MKADNKKDFYMRERFLPEDHRSFCSGALTINIDRFGGLESVEYLNSMYRPEKTYPARRPVMFFSRKGGDVANPALPKSFTRPYISPTIRNVCEYSDGYVRTPCPEFPEIFPNALRSENYELVMGTKCFSMKVNAERKPARRFVLTFAKPQYSAQSKTDNNYNQLAHEHVWLPPEYRGEDFDENWPFPDGELLITAIIPYFDEKLNALVFCKKLSYPAYQGKLYFVATSSEPLHFYENKNDWHLSTDMTDKASHIFGCGMGETLEQAYTRAQKALKSHKNALAAADKLTNKNATAPVIKMEHCPEAERFAQIYPAYQHGLVCEESDKQACLRASYGKYGFFAIWDHIYPARDFLMANEPEMTRKCLEYMVDYPHWYTNPFVMIHLAIALDEYLAFTKDMSLLKEFYPGFKKAFAFAETLVDKNTGLLHYGIDTAVDVMEELGLSKLFYASCINGWWYDACCCFINFAKDMKDKAFEKKAKGYEKLLSDNYEKIFFNKEAGYIRAAVQGIGKHMTHEVYLHTKSLPMDYSNGAWLFRHMATPMADYLMKRLYHPWGVSAVAYDCEAPCLYLKGTRMNQHLGHSCKMLRQSNHIDGVEHLLNGYMYVFHQTQCAVETFNYSFVEGDQVQRADWQAFSATAAVQAIFQGVLGLFWHRGGLCYIPADEDAKNSIKNFRFGGKNWDISISGKGGSIKSIKVNGKVLSGTYQIPEDAVSGDKAVIEIVRAEKSDGRPVLQWAIGAAVANVKSGANELQFTVQSDCRAQFAFLVSRQAKLSLNGKAVQAEYDANAGRLWYSGDVKPGDVVAVKYSK